MTTAKHQIADADPEPEPIPARSTDPRTTQDAARKVNLTEREKACLAIYEQQVIKHVLASAPHADLSNEELGDLDSSDQTSSVSSRRSGLFRKGCVRLTGNRRKSRGNALQDCLQFVPVDERAAQREINLTILEERHKNKKPTACPVCGETHACKKPVQSVTASPVLDDFEEL